MTEVFCRGDISLGSACLECGRCAVNLAKHYKRAVATLQRLGYTDCGGELWKPRRGVFDGGRKVMDESGAVHMKPSADLPEPAWRAATIRTTEDAYSAEQMRQQFDAGRSAPPAPATVAVPEQEPAAFARLLGRDFVHAVSPQEKAEAPEEWADHDVPLYAAIGPSLAAPWKDHQTARLVNDLRDCALQYHGAGQLRERIAHIVAPLCDQLKTATPAPAQQDGARYRVLRDNPRIAHRFAGLHAWQRDQYVDAVRAAAKKEGAG